MNSLIELAKQLAGHMRYCAVDANDCGGCARMREYKGSMKCIDDLMNNAAEAIEALAEMLQREQKWIPVTERVPEPLVKVVTFRDGVLRIDHYETDRFACDYKNGRATHWMPLPYLPEEDTEC